MTALSNATISKLSDSGQTVTLPADDIRGLTVKDENGKDLGKVHDLLTAASTTTMATCRTGTQLHLSGLLHGPEAMHPLHVLRAATSRRNSYDVSK